MAGPSLTSIDNILKTDVKAKMVEVINTEQVAQKRIEARQQVQDVGYEFTWTFKSGFSEGVGTMAWNGALPQARQSKYKSLTSTCKTLAGRIRIYQQLRDWTNNQDKAYADVVMDEIESAANAARCEKERFTLLDGGTTALATISSAADSSTIVTVTLAAATSGAATKYLRPGMPIDVYNGTSAISGATNLEITEVTGDTTFTITCASSSDADTLATAIAGSYSVYHYNGYTNEPDGLKSWFGYNDNTIFGVDRSAAANTYFRPYLCYVDGNGKIAQGTPTGTAVDWQLKNIHQVVSYLMTTRKVAKKDLLGFCDEGVAAYMLDLRQNQGGYHLDTGMIDAWPYDGIKFEGIEIVSPNYMPLNALCFVDLSNLWKLRNADLDWSSGLDGQMWKWVADYNAYEAFFYETYQMGHKVPSNCAWIGDLKGLYD
jgi:hypothetical protein